MFRFKVKVGPIWMELPESIPSKTESKIGTNKCVDSTALVT